MKILIEGLPGTKKNQIYDFLKKKYGVEVGRGKRGVAWDRHYSGNHSCESTAFPMECEMILQAKERADKFIIHDSEYAIVNVWGPHLVEMGMLDYQLELLKKMGKCLLDDADVIIYLHGDLDKCFERATGPQLNMSKEKFTDLYSKYEWAFDSHNCNIKMFKINVEEEFEMVVNSILGILKQIVELKDKLHWEFV